MDIELMHAYSGKQAMEIINQCHDISIILLDIVMEEDDSGLKLINYIRNTLKNIFVRIVIRTGQPGQAPERKVIIDYDINDYKEKTELTSQKLFSTIIASLRSYDNIITIENNRKSLEKLIDVSYKLFFYRKIEEFTNDILHLLFEIFTAVNPGFNKDINCFLAVNYGDGFIIQSGTGIYEKKAGEPVKKSITSDIKKLIDEVGGNSQGFYKEKGRLLNCFKSKTGYAYLIYMEYQNQFNENHVSLFQLVFNTVSSAFDNICLNNDIISTQSELLITLGGVIETRSEETGHHVKKVAEYSKLLALKYGLGEEKAELIRQASPMHDIGKVGVFDQILNKPGKYTTEEFEEMKKHTRFGYEIFKNSSKEIFKTASIIALQHHEKYDGTGYPAGLKGEEIHIYGRITSLADVFDALNRERPYKKAWELNEVLDYIQKESGKSFDPKLVKIFFDNLHEFLLIKDGPEK
jgi:response regulator RpfG family c-di-GMP phosphodiesterase